MNSLFKKRLSSHLTEMLKYLRLVFNDYFVLALMFMVGGLGYYYSGVLKDLHKGTWWAPLLVIVFFLITVQFGRLATLIEDPDYVFLLPRESEMPKFFKAGYRYSLVIALAIQVILWFISIPFIERTLTVETISLLCSLVLLKITWLTSDFIRKFKVKTWLSNRLIFRWCWPLVVLGISLYTNAVLGTIFALVMLLITLVFSMRLAVNVPVDWQTAISDENSRMHTIYSFFNLFTDVKSMSGSVNRRKYLDWVVSKIKLKSENTYLYLYSHGIIRDTEMSGLFARLTLIGMVLLAFIAGTWLPVILSVLFIYLIGFQLIPFYYHFDNNAFVHIYPIDRKNQLSSFQTVIRNMLTVTAVLFAVVVILVNLHNPVTIIAVIVAEILELLGFVYLYVPSRIKKAYSKR